MHDSRRSNALHAALRFVMSSDALCEHKAILIETLLQALRDEESAELSQRVAEQTIVDWQEHELVEITTQLQDRVAMSWQDADECVMHLATQLRRDPRSIRDKVMELGLGASIDYRIANAVRHVRREKDA